MVRELLVEAREMRRKRRRPRGSAARPVAVDSLHPDDTLDLVERGEHRTLHRDRGVAAVGRERVLRASAPAKSAEHQPPLRPDAPKPTCSRSQTATRNDGSALQQRVRGPEARVAGADDGDVGIDVARKGRPHATRAVPRVSDQRLTITEVCSAA